jgi:hypothetical protein
MDTGSREENAINQRAELLGAADHFTEISRGSSSRWIASPSREAAFPSFEDDGAFAFSQSSSMQALKREWPRERGHSQCGLT